MGLWLTCKPFCPKRTKQVFPSPLYQIWNQCSDERICSLCSSNHISLLLWWIISFWFLSLILGIDNYVHRSLFPFQDGLSSFATYPSASRKSEQWNTLNHHQNQVSNYHDIPPSSIYLKRLVLWKIRRRRLNFIPEVTNNSIFVTSECNNGRRLY